MRSPPYHPVEAVAKGIVLAGGLGTRLQPLTSLISKQLLPVYDRPMIYYSLATLMQAGIREILIISTPASLPRYERMLESGRQWGVTFRYFVQPKPGGLPQAFLIGRKFIDRSPVCLALGDNLFLGAGWAAPARAAAESRRDGATIFACPVRDPRSYGVIEFDARGNPVHIREKPARTRSKYAVPGLYFYDQHVADIAASLRPSARGELEIADLNQAYLDRGALRVERLENDCAWFDAGTPEALLEAANYVRESERRAGKKGCCPEQVAYENGWIRRYQLRRLAEPMQNSVYGQYLMRLIGARGSRGKR